MSNAKYRIVADGIIDDIRSQRLKPGDRIASVRDLVAQGHSSTTARNAHRWLQENGWIVVERGSAGSFVADPLPKTEPSLEARVADLERRFSQFEAEHRPND